MNFQLSFLLGFLFTTAFSAPTSQVSRRAVLPLPSTVVHQFPLPAWLENIAVRSNGHLLLNRLDRPDLYTITGATTSPTLIHTFPGITGLFGIEEVFPDVFVIGGGNFTISNASSVPGTYSVWTVNFRDLTTRGLPRVVKIANFPRASWLNGIARLPTEVGSVLIADSILGAIWKLNILTGVTSIVAQNRVKLAPTTTGPVSLGINGLSVTNDGKTLYWTNSNTASLYRARITPSGYILPNQQIEKLATDPVLVDDFTLDEKRGLAWVTTNFRNTVFAVDIEGRGTGRKVDIVGAADQLTVAGSTAVAFGRSARDQETLYVVTGGGQAVPVNGTLFEGGKVVAVDTRGFAL